jgi:ferredoxin
MKAMKVVVDDDVCVASGSCVLACPNVFEQDDVGMVVLLEPSPGLPDHDDVRHAASVCPVAAIDIVEE